jgi:hypothetical protein
MGFQEKRMPPHHLEGGAVGRTIELRDAESEELYSLGQQINCWMGTLVANAPEDPTWELRYGLADEQYQAILRAIECKSKFQLLITDRWSDGHWEKWTCPIQRIEPSPIDIAERTVLMAGPDICQRIA